MKYRDVVAQLQAELPKHDSRFSETVALNSLSPAGATITAVTSAAHGRATGDAVTIAGSAVLNPTTLNVSGTTVTGVTDFDHDLTEFMGFGEIPSYATVTISGTNESEYNGAFKVKSVPNRRTFTYELNATPSGPPTGSSILEETRIDGYNGRFLITVSAADTFTYEVQDAPPGDAVITDALVSTKLRISTGVNAERLFDAYTKQDVGKMWAFVIPGDTDISNDRKLLNDANVSWATGTQDRRTKTIVNFSVMVIFPTTREIAAMDSRDDAEDIAVALYKSLGGFKPSSPLSNPSQFVLTPTGHGFVGYVGAYYAHGYNWQLVEEITEADTFKEGDRAFRDVRLIFTNDFDEIIINTNIDLDDQPL